MSKSKPGPLPENRTIQIEDGYHVGWFYGSEKFGSRQIIIGVGSAFKNSPADGKWLSLTEARKLRDTLTRILDK